MYRVCAKGRVFEDLMQGLFVAQPPSNQDVHVFCGYCEAPFRTC